MLRMLWLTIAHTLAAPSANAEASTACLWMLLNDSHEIASACGSRLGDDAERRYARLLQAEGDEIVRDASLNPGGSADKAKDFLQKYAARTTKNAATFCKGSEYVDAVLVLNSLTRPENVAHLLGALRARKDPFRGEFL